jgi:lysophospholipase L1-like esterase
MHTHTLDAPDHRELDDPFCLTDDVAVRLLADAPWRRLAVIGDSIAEGLGDPVDGYRDLPWAERLADGLSAAVGDLSYLNLGVRGLTAGEIRRTQLTDALAFSPDLAVVSAGANDLLGGRFDPDDLRAEVDAIVGPLAECGALVVTFGLLDLSRVDLVPATRRSALREGLIRLNALTREVTERHRGVFVDFFDHPAIGASLFSADLLHPNRRGHAHIAAQVVRSLARRLGGVLEDRRP